MNLTKEQIKDLFEKSESENKILRYVKTAKVDARLATPGESILTVIDGKIETSNVAKETDVIVMNIETKCREQYILEHNKFVSRYQSNDQLSDKWISCVAKGEVDAVQYNGENIEFMAPWDELMVMESGDYLCRVPGTLTNIYRIAQIEFNKTYTLKVN